MERASRSEILTAIARDKSTISQLQNEFNEVVANIFPYSFLYQREINLFVAFLHDFLSIKSNSIGEDLASIVPVSIHYDTNDFPEEQMANVLESPSTEIRQTYTADSSTSDIGLLLSRASNPPSHSTSSTRSEQNASNRLNDLESTQTSSNPPEHVGQPQLPPFYRILLSIFTHLPHYYFSANHVRPLVPVPEFSGFWARVSIRMRNYFCHYCPLFTRSAWQYVQQQNYGLFFKYGIFVTIAHRLLRVTYGRQSSSPFLGSKTLQDPFEFTFVGQILVLVSEIYLTCKIAPWVFFGGRILWNIFRQKCAQLRYLIWRICSTLMPRVIAPPAVVPLHRMLIIQQQYQQQQAFESLSTTNRSGNNSSSSNSSGGVSSSLSQMHPVSAVLTGQQQQQQQQQQHEHQPLSSSQPNDSSQVNSSSQHDTTLSKQLAIASRIQPHVFPFAPQLPRHFRHQIRKRLYRYSLDLSFIHCGESTNDDVFIYQNGITQESLNAYTLDIDDNGDLSDWETDPYEDYWACYSHTTAHNEHNVDGDDDDDDDIGADKNTKVMKTRGNKSLRQQKQTSTMATTGADLVYLPPFENKLSSVDQCSDVESYCQNWYRYLYNITHQHSSPESLTPSPLATSESQSVTSPSPHIDSFFENISSDDDDDDDDTEKTLNITAIPIRFAQAVVQRTVSNPDSLSQSSQPETSCINPLYERALTTTEPPTGPLALRSCCGICLCNAQQTCATICGHLFCWDCIFHYVQAKHECPNCRTPCTPGQLLRCHQFG